MFSTFLSRLLNLFSRAVHPRRDPQRAAKNKHEEFLSDIDALNRTIELAERKRIMDTKRESGPSPSLPPSNSNGSQSDYVSMDQAKQSERLQTSGAKEGQEEEELHFFWELLRFAKNRSWKKKLMTVLIFSSSAYVLIDLVFLGNIMKLIENFLTWMTNHSGAAVGCFLGFFVLATLLFVPPTILYFGAGYAFCDVAGFWPGMVAATVVCFMGSSMGAVLAFLRSRYMMRDLIELFARRFPIVKCLDQAIHEKGFRVMLMMRLCPIVPFNGLNYIGGVTNISMEEYVFALVGVIPNIILWVLVGASADHLRNRDTDDKGEFIFLIISMCAGIVFAAVGLYLLYRYGRDELHKEIKEQRAVSWHTFAKDDSEKSSSQVGDDPIEEGFEAMEQQPGGLIAVFGLDHHVVEPSTIPEDGHDEDWLWIWA